MNQETIQILEGLYDGAYCVDTSRRITYWNRAAERITGFPASEVIGHRCSDNILIHINEEGENLCRSGCPLVCAIGGGEPREAEIYLHHRNGHRLPVNTRIIPLRDDSGKITGAVELFSDATSAKALSERLEELERLALIDELTQISNRRRMTEEIGACIQESRRSGLKFGIMMLDIDHFKEVNDTYGHEVGDRTLKTVAQTLNHAVRIFDTLGRWGGEEFLGLIRTINLDTLARVAERCRMLVENTVIHIGEQRINVTASIGATAVREHDTVAGLVDRADALMYQSKSKGRNRVTTRLDP